MGLTKHYVLSTGAGARRYHGAQIVNILNDTIAAHITGALMGPYAALRAELWDGGGRRVGYKRQIRRLWEWIRFNRRGMPTMRAMALTEYTCRRGTKNKAYNAEIRRIYGA